MHKSLVLVAAAAAALTLVQPLHGAGVYPDPTGDSSTATDIQRVDVTSTAAGEITFRITLNVFTVPSPALLILSLDSDANPATGPQQTLGADYRILVDASEPSYGFEQWNGTGYVDSPLTASVSSTSTSVTIAVNRTSLGNTGELNFWIRSLKTDDGQFDDAPNEGTFSYSLELEGPAVKSVAIRTAPGQPRAGRAFTVNSTLVRIASTTAELVPATSFRCRARLAGKAIRGTGANRCRFALPKGSKGKRLVITVDLTYQGGSYTIPYSFRVR